MAYRAQNRAGAYMTPKQVRRIKHKENHHGFNGRPETKESV